MSLTSDIRAGFGWVSIFSGVLLSGPPLIYELGIKALHGLFPRPVSCCQIAALSEEWSGKGGKGLKH